jgi:hypothetical protein
MNNDNANDARTALDSIIAAHMTMGGAATCLADYLDDPAAISSPSLIANLDKLIRALTSLPDADPDDIDDTTIAEHLATIDPTFSRLFCERTELCPTHFSDPETCADEH